MRKVLFRVILSIYLSVFNTVFCFPGHGQNREPEAPSTEDKKTLIANPASEYCIKTGGRLVIRKDKDGGEYGICIFNNKECEEWAYFRGECDQEGNTKKTFTTDDPFEYCSFIGTIDVPDKRYKGVKMPDSIISSMIHKGLISPDTPIQFIENSVWRCMNKKVFVCMYGANIPCMEKGDVTKKPGKEMLDFCRENPSADTIPAYVSGRKTVYEWRCIEGRPDPAKQVHTVDERGYIKTFWHELRKE
ncbi:MAG: DUF333 domain-containing protein [Syntrophorhabdaceae bacterium]|nr:DUF333 domain-containing protein [Syntrophorhabdaceae bacterium]